ncbi:Lipopolysaccharide biosynthesis protein [Methylocella tundrae]|uniref:Lipopolysaccharide biosynthesis protein n=1 Tax=Methylocella tundrae TaxID=227605 RepID=A0A8B6M892_METTU|nr:hypothetical protein [Methylocella tundrae]VTZ51100.1 Lipopolysaccharide biosynthesis protein [Methylocella tundrae]
MHWLDWEEPDVDRPHRLDLFREAVAARKKALVAAALAAPFAAGLFLALTPLQYRAETELYIAAPVNAPAQSANDADSLIGEARLIASRDLGRRAIKELRIDARPEFDPLARGVGPIARALISLGLMSDPARVSQDERILKSYEDRLSVSASEAQRLVTIAFRSRDRAFAASAANRIASLYLEMRAVAEPREAGEPGITGSVISPAVVPRRPLLPGSHLIFAIGAGAAALAAFGFGAFRRPPRPPSGEEPMALPRAVGDFPFFVRLKKIPEFPPSGGRSAASRRAEAENAVAFDEIAAHILAARRPSKGLRIVGAKLSSAYTAPDIMLALARLLGSEGRSIAVSLDAAEADDADALPACEGPGLSDLLAGGASFSAVIRRDPRSRLHFVPAGGAGPIDISELSNVIDALARTYDFIWLRTPPLEANDMAKTLAADADFLVLEAAPEAHDCAIARAEAELREAGARSILVIGAVAPVERSIGQDAA